ncbi:MAG: hypothetical protein WBI20_15350 [Burkholderiaceae bacterium]
MILVVSSIKLIVEIALMAMLGLWLLGLLAGAKKDKNLFYQLLGMVVKPFISLARLLTPKLVLQRHLPLVAFLLLAVAWIAATLFKIQLCLQVGLEQCK